MTSNTMLPNPFKGTEPCATADPNIFFEGYDQLPHNTPARTNHLNMIRTAYCNKCPLMKTGECHKWALKHEQYGIWAGVDKNQRALDRRRFGIAYENPFTIAFRDNYKDKEDEDVA